MSGLDYQENTEALADAAELLAKTWRSLDTLTRSKIDAIAGDDHHLSLAIWQVVYSVVSLRGSKRLQMWDDVIARGTNEPTKVLPFPLPKGATPRD